MKKVSYYICSAENMSALWKEVLNRCDEGWIPVGGISIDSNTLRGEIKYFQAMIKEKDDPCTKD